MNILCLSDDGYGSVGLEILKESARAHFGQTAKIIAITVKEPASGKSFSITPNMRGDDKPYVDYEEVEPFNYVVDGTPMDCLYLGMLYPSYVLGMQTFDVVLAGVNHGHNVGVDVFHSGTVAMALMASTFFGVPSVAFSQELPNELEMNSPESINTREHFRVAETFTRKVLQQHQFSPGTCLNVNFPKASPKGYRQAPPAPYSRWLPTQQSTREKTNDIIAVRDGFISVSNLELSVAPPMNL